MIDPLSYLPARPEPEACPDSTTSGRPCRGPSGWSYEGFHAARIDARPDEAEL